MSSTRIYLVTGGAKPRLVEASSQAQAVGYVVRGQFVAAVPSQEELVHHVLNGTTVERDIADE